MLCVVNASELSLDVQVTDALLCTYWRTFIGHCNCCRESAETIVLLEAIMEGLSDSRSGARRELCANAAREFLVWSAKHIPMAKPKQGSSSQRVSHPSSNLNAASLLRRLFDRLVHPQTYQRSAVAAWLFHNCDAVLNPLAQFKTLRQATKHPNVQSCVKSHVA